MTARRILVVEDEWLIAEDVEEMLRAEGFEVVGPVPTVRAALELLETQAVDAALLDIHLTHETSFPVAEALMARGLPFVFVSGYAVTDLPPRFQSCRLLSKPAQAHTVAAAFGQEVTPPGSVEGSGARRRRSRGPERGLS